MALNKDEIDAVAKVAQEIIKPAYDDAIKPAALEVGKSLETLAATITMALMPIRLVVHTSKEIEINLKNRISKKLNGIDEANLQLPPLNVFGPLLEKYKYNYDTEILSDMFLSLLANSMDSETSKNAHPAFIEVISQLSPDEGRLLKTLVTAYVLPKIDVLVEDIKLDGFDIAMSNYMGEGFSKNLEHPELYSLYLDNLKRLNLIDFNNTRSYKEGRYYDVLISSEEIKTLELKLDKDTKKLNFNRGFVEITNFGRAFYKAVTREEKAER